MHTFRLVAIIVASVLCASQTPAASGGAYFSAGPGYRAEKVSLAGLLIGSLKPSTSFASTAHMDGVTANFAAGYDTTLDNGIYLGVDASLDYVGRNRQLASVDYSVTATQFVDSCFPAPFPGLPCVSFGSHVNTFSESQSLHLSLKDSYAGSLGLRAGYAWGTTKLFLSAGASVDRLGLSYNLPALATVVPPVPFVTIGLPPLPSVEPIPAAVSFPAENRVATTSRFGWSAGAGFEQAINDTYSVRASYSYADYGSSPLADSTRVKDVSLRSSAYSVSVVLTAHLWAD